jgi:CRP-like cAMP-binding protein
MQILGYWLPIYLPIGKIDQLIFLSHSVPPIAMPNSLIHFLKQHHSFSAAAEKYIEAAFKPVIFKEGEELSRPGTINKELFFIVDGVLRIVIRNEKGNEITHYFLKENQFCTILNSFHNQVPAEEWIQAACSCEVLQINRVALLNLYQQVPDLQALIDQITQQALINKINVRNAYLGQDSTNRYRLFITRQADIARRVSLTDTASYLGITPQSLSRIRKQI